jgi:hypothetical protein
MTGITTYLSILTLNVSKLNSPIKKHHLANWIKKEDPTICCLQETHFTDRNKHWLRVKGWKKIYKGLKMPRKTGRSSNTYLRQSKLQTYIDQTMILFSGCSHLFTYYYWVKLSTNQEENCFLFVCSLFFGSAGDQTQHPLGMLGMSSTTALLTSQPLCPFLEMSLSTEHSCASH